MAVYPKGNKFMGSVGAGKTRIRQTFRTEQEATEWVAQEEAKRAPKGASPVSPTLPLTAPVWTLQEAYNAAHRKLWRGKGGERTSVNNANTVLAFFGADTPVSAINAKSVDAFIRERQDEHENSNSTINGFLAVLNGMLKESVKLGGLEAMPKVEYLSKGDHRIAWFSDALEAQMLAKCAELGLHELADLIVLGVDTGFRRAEMLGLTTMDYQAGMLILHAGATKNGLARSVPATPRVKAIIQQRIDAGQSRIFQELRYETVRNVWDPFRKAMGREDDPFFIIHVLRHTCATRLVAAGVPLITVKEWMGHKTIETTMRYAHFQPKQLLAAAEMLEARVRE